MEDSLYLPPHFYEASYAPGWCFFNRDKKPLATIDITKNLYYI